ncbi:MAG: guanylate kinase, partial [Fidelibacterota bacterium]
DFRRKISNGELVEWAEVHGHLYGTPRSEIERALTNGDILLLEIDIQGGVNIKRAYPQDTVLIFIKPPSLGVLKERLLKRGEDSEEEIEKRLKRVPEENLRANDYDHVVVNDKLEDAVNTVMKIIKNRTA